MSKSASCVDWFVLRQCVDLWVEAVSLRLLEDKILCGNHVVACQVGDRVFVAGVRPSDTVAVYKISDCC